MEMSGNSPNGKAQLFRKGMIQRSWTFKNGVETGRLTLYRNGLVDREIDWSEIDKMDKSQDDVIIRSFIFSGDGRRLLEESINGDGMVIYVGEYEPESNLRHGKGIEYDETTGVEKLVGYYQNGQLVHIIQEFELVTHRGRVNEKEPRQEMQMIEYGGDISENNVLDSTTRLPIYCGGYTFDEWSFTFVRDGLGRCIDSRSGICMSIATWQFGKELSEDKPVYFAERDERNNEIILSLQLMRDCEKKVSIIPELDYCIDLFVENLSFSDHFLTNQWEISMENITMMLSYLPKLKSIVIGYGSCSCVGRLIIQGLVNLQSIAIGKQAFRGNGNLLMHSLFRVKDCPNLKTMVFGDESFVGYEKFEVRNTPSLTQIKFGNDCFLRVNDFVLKGA